MNHFLAPPRFDRYTCYPESFGHYYDDPSHSERRAAGQIDCYNLHIVYGGKGYLRIGDRLVALEAGTGFLYGPGVEQSYYAEPSDPWDIRWVHFQGTGVGKLLQGKGEEGVWTFSWRNADAMLELWQELLGHGVPSLTGGEARLSALLYEILALLVQNAEDEQGQQAAGRRNSVIEAAEWIRSHSGQPLTLEQMANEADCSVSHFSRQFHRLIGKTPIEFLTECRIVQAKIMLVSTKLPVNVVADKVGFASSAYFIRRFRLLEGVTPEQFRRIRGG
ncbi:helix-turn-helix transcriptional regulator [Cohnella yongneupensis]|uniref:AraC family transcriptional regulator n=1 Tax=Cohnella yongneupensis TaxID=425006 RepID=A0ABW0QXU2_9BACL